MATKEQLIHKIKYLTDNQLKSLLNNLAKTKDIDTTLSKEDIELSSDDISNIKEILIFLIENDENFSREIQTAIEANDEPRSIDIIVDLNTLAEVITLGITINNFIKAKYPNRVERTDIKIERGYSNISDTIKSIAELIKGLKND